MAQLVRLFTVPYFSLDASETKESTKYPWVMTVGLIGHFDTLPSFARIKRPRWRPVELNDRRDIYDLSRKHSVYQPVGFLDRLCSICNICLFLNSVCN